MGIFAELADKGLYGCTSVVGADGWKWGCFGGDPHMESVVGFLTSCNLKCGQVFGLTYLDVGSTANRKAIKA